MPTLKILNTAVRAAASFGRPGDGTTAKTFTAPTAQLLTFDFPSTPWDASTGLMMEASFQVSYDGGVTWLDGGAFFGAQSGLLGSNGLVQHPQLRFFWSGAPISVRGSVLVGPQAFSWGLTVTWV